MLTFMWSIILIFMWQEESFSLTRLQEAASQLDKTYGCLDVWRPDLTPYKYQFWKPRLEVAILLSLFLSEGWASKRQGPIFL